MKQHRYRFFCGGPLYSVALVANLPDEVFNPLPPLVQRVVIITFVMGLFVGIISLVAGLVGSKDK